ncbi:MAG: hypothetical protein AB1765_05185 [Candidatus Hydrogenedentota bacterium]
MIYHLFFIFLLGLSIIFNQGCSINQIKNNELVQIYNEQKATIEALVPIYQNIRADIKTRIDRGDTKVIEAADTTIIFYNDDTITIYPGETRVLLVYDTYIISKLLEVDSKIVQAYYRWKELDEKIENTYKAIKVASQAALYAMVTLW